MNILCIDTSSVYASCALLKDEQIISEKTVLSGLVHSKSIMPLVEQVLESANVDIEEIDIFSCVAGPGSFTGVRIGVCATKGLAQAMNKPCYAVKTLDCLKENVPYFKTVCPILDARRSQVYSAVYENGELIREYDVCPLEEVLEFLKNKKTLFLGDGVKPFKEKISSILGENAIFAPLQHNFIRAASGAYLTLKAYNENKLITYNELDAIYLRKPQAEREYENRNSLT
ncbi:MAG: tRNA (adenosine(37)-N6)-threonylcarbamoyltransferase complex dimerization subunit type 1 TsaB [Clostridiales bacterium]|nr:tRNA (adenosine(37)-N6)-threonylcarbamoyltransferase complex dimerization subunit type 1 TsaB [Clostridiales bacterium]